MNKEMVHVYFMPGMAANPSIFEHIRLPEDQFTVHRLEWTMPQSGECLSEYAKRMCSKIDYEEPVLLGVSFGGILVQEMSKHVKFKKIIVVSSVKNKYELPKRMKVLKHTKAYKLLPTQLVGNIELLAKYAFGETIKKRVDLYRKYLSVSDKKYLDWAIEQMVCWEQERSLPETIHIHGEKDAVFPFKNLEDCISIEGGTHTMIINKFRWFNENLPKIILG